MNIKDEMAGIERGKKCDRCDNPWTEEFGDVLLCLDCTQQYLHGCNQGEHWWSCTEEVVAESFEPGDDLRACAGHAADAGFVRCASPDCDEFVKQDTQRRFCAGCHQQWLTDRGEKLDQRINDDDVDEDEDDAQ